jgi:hypothetical protein
MYNPPCLNQTQTDESTTAALPVGRSRGWNPQEESSMRRVLTTVLAVALLLGLGALAVLALPNGSAPLAGAPAVSAAAPEFQDAPEAVLATNKVNVIAMPLNATNQFTNAGKSFDADGLAAIAGTGVVQVSTWDATSASYRSWDPIAVDGDNFSLAVGGNYRLVLDSTANTIVSFVGDVPAQGSVKFNLVRPTSGACRVNDISLPLDQAAITTADQLAIAVGNVEQVLEWVGGTQSYRSWDVLAQDGDNFAVKIGYPYRLCLAAAGSTTWP